MLPSRSALISLVVASVPDDHPKARVVVLVSGAGTNLQALLDAQEGGHFPGEVVAVGADRTQALGLARARDADVATFVISPDDFIDRAAWDRALADELDRHRPDWIVSAGFMRLLGTSVLSRFPNRILNTHPALLPAFPGANAVRDALAYGVKVTGCTVHLIDAGIDTGPVVAQRAVLVEDDDDEARLHERIKVVERTLLVDVVGRAACAGLDVSGRRVRFGNGD